MEILSELEKISSRTIFKYVVLMSALICPGFLFIFVFNMPLFQQLDLLKLVLLSISIMMPFFVFNATCASMITFKKEKSLNFDGMLTLGTLFTAASFCITIAIGFLVNLMFKDAIKLLLETQLLNVLMLLLFERLGLGKRQEKSNVNSA